MKRRKPRPVSVDDVRLLCRLLTKRKKEQPMQRSAAMGANEVLVIAIGFLPTVYHVFSRWQRLFENFSLISRCSAAVSPPPGTGPVPAPAQTAREPAAALRAIPSVHTQKPSAIPLQPMRSDRAAAPCRPPRAPPAVSHVRGDKTPQGWMPLPRPAVSRGYRRPFHTKGGRSGHGRPPRAPFPLDQRSSAYWLL